MRTTRVIISLVLVVTVALGVLAVPLRPSAAQEYPEVPDDCSQVLIAPGYTYFLGSGTVEYRAWAAFGGEWPDVEMIHDYPNGASNILYAWGEGPGKTVFANLDHGFRSLDPNVGVTVILCPVSADPPDPPPADCWEQVIAADGSYALLDEARRLEAWQRYPGEPDILYDDTYKPPARLLAIWGEGPGNFVTPLNDPIFYNQSTTDATTLLLCPLEPPPPQRCTIYDAQMVDIIEVDNDPNDSLEPYNHQPRMLFVVPEASTNDAGFVSAFPVFPFYASENIYIPPANLDGKIIRALNYDDANVKHWNFDIVGDYLEDGGAASGTTDWDKGHPMYVQSADWASWDYLTFEPDIPIGTTGTYQMEICDAPPPPVDTRPDQCIGGAMDKVFVRPFNTGYSWVHIWEDELQASQWTGQTTNVAHAAANQNVFLAGDFYGWTLESSSARVTLHYDVRAETSTYFRRVIADPEDGQVTIIDHTDDIMVLGADENATFQLCPPASLPTNTPTPTPTATPVPPVGCYIQPIAAFQDSTLQFASMNDIYRWYTAIQWVMGGQSGQLADYGGTPLSVGAGDNVTFSPPNEHPSPELLVCPQEEPTPTATSTLTPTATATPDPYLDPRCEVLHSEYDPAPAAAPENHRINFGAYGYRATTGGYHLVVESDLAYRIRVLNGAPGVTRHTSLDPGNRSWTSWTPTDGWGTFPSLGSIYDRISYDDVSAFSIQVCREVPLPTNTSTPTRTPTASRTGTAQPTLTDVALPTFTSALTSTAACVPVPTVPTARLGTVPDLAIAVPTFEPLPVSITATVVITTAQIETTVAQTTNGMRTPQAALSTAIAGYTWQSGADTAASWAAAIQPALSWLAIANPQNPAYQTVGGPLWALAPVLMPVLPIILVSIMIVFVRFFFWLLDWLRKLIEVVFGLIELIPGE